MDWITRSFGTSQVSDFTAKVRTVLATLFASVLAILLAASAISGRRSSISLLSVVTTVAVGFASAAVAGSCAWAGMKQAIHRARSELVFLDANSIGISSWVREWCSARSNSIPSDSIGRHSLLDFASSPKSQNALGL